MTETIAIQNPLPGATTRVGYKRAARLVKRKRAQWVSDSEIHLLEDHSLQTALAAERVNEFLKKMRTGANYDCINRPITLDEIINIPVVMPQRLIAKGPSQVVAGRTHHRNGKVRIIQQFQGVTQ